MPPLAAVGDACHTLVAGAKLTRPGRAARERVVDPIKAWYRPCTSPAGVSDFLSPK